jgi:hypothetical protein
MLVLLSLAERGPMINMSLEKSGLLAPGAAERWAKARGVDVKGALIKALKAARPETDAILKQETQRAFKVASGGKFLKAWRTRVLDGREAGPVMPGDIGQYGIEITNLARWFKIQVVGGSIANRTTPHAILVPINTRLGARISAKKFYKIIDWLMQEKLTLIKNGILYVKPLMNESRRGGVAVGTRVNKRFRQKFQGSSRRPSGFDIKLNEHGLTPIAIVRTSIGMKKRFDFERIVSSRVMPVLAAKITNELSAAGRKL